MTNLWPLEIIERCHGDLMTWKHSPHYLPFVRGIRWIPLTKSQLWEPLFFFVVNLNKLLKKHLYCQWFKLKDAHVTSSLGWSCLATLTYLPLRTIIWIILWPFCFAVFLNFYWFWPMFPCNVCVCLVGCYLFTAWKSMPGLLGGACGGG